MAAYELKNEAFSIRLDSRGGELKSLKRLDTGLEYMWQGDSKYWGRTSPVLFPFVGGLKNKEFKAKGKSYPMSQHGFARDMEFELLSKTEEEIWFVLSASEATQEKYPYEFVLKLGYLLTKDGVEVLWQVENSGKEILPFSIGGHPAFNCPIEEGASREECFVEFFGVDEVVSRRIGETGLATDCMDVYMLQDRRIALTEKLFEHDALVIENNQTRTVALCKKDGGPYLKVAMETPLFGIWSPPGKNAPFVCIEPWCGRCDHENFEGVLEEREWGNLLKPGEIFKASYKIEAF